MKHLENNKYFTQIANVIHENHGIPDDMETFLKNLRTNKLLNESYVGCTADGNSNNITSWNRLLLFASPKASPQPDHEVASANIPNTKNILMLPVPPCWGPAVPD